MLRGGHCPAPQLTKPPAPTPAAPMQSGPLRVNAVLKIAVEVCRGMDYLHKRKIVHRDLKVRRGCEDGQLCSAGPWY